MFPVKDYDHQEMVDKFQSAKDNFEKMKAQFPSHINLKVFPSKAGITLDEKTISLQTYQDEGSLCKTLEIKTQKDKEHAQSILETVKAKTAEFKEFESIH